MIDLGEKGKLLIKLKKALGANYRDNTEDILYDLFLEMYSIALNTSHFNSKNSKNLLYPYVKEAVISKYLRLGAEGLSSKSEGSQSSSFIDIEDKLRNDIIKSDLRRLP